LIGGSAEKTSAPKRVERKQIGDDLLGRSTLIGIASLMSLINSAHGVIDFRLRLPAAPAACGQ
jgi:hypothetical protein